MAINTGVWIDHRKAVIVRLTDQGEEIRQIDSGVEHPELFANSALSTNPYTRNDFVAEDKLQRKFARKLSKYFDEVIACIRDANAVLILGPGEAKVELHKRMEGKKLGDCIAGMQAADKLTDHQIAASVRHYFASQLST